MIPKATKFFWDSLTRRWKYMALWMLIMLLVSADIFRNKIASKFLGIKKPVNRVDTNLYFTWISDHLYFPYHSFSCPTVVYIETCHYIQSILKWFNQKKSKEPEANLSAFIYNLYLTAPVIYCAIICIHEWRNLCQEK